MGSPTFIPPPPPSTSNHHRIGLQVLHAILHVLILFAADETFCDELATAHSMLVFVVTQLNTIDLEEYAIGSG